MRIPALMLILVFMAASMVNCQAPAEKATAKQVIDNIIKQTGNPVFPKTVDVIKEGDPSTVVTGIVTTMFGTMDVLKEAVRLKCNLIIVHEPLYYNHLDETEQFKNDDVYKEKHKYIKDHNLVIWRFHDYIHSMKPDGISSGMVDKLGWKEYVVNGDDSHFRIPRTTLNGLCADLKQKFPKYTFYVIGDPLLNVSDIRLAAGAPGSSAHIMLLEDKSTDVVLAGESQQWETYEYARDAVQQGRNKAIIFLGHIASEEAGMDFCAKWLKGFVGNIPVHFVEAGPSYRAY